MKTLKKTMLVALAMIMALAMCACGEEELSEVANPFVDVESAEELAEVTPFPIEAPEGATDAVYAYCEDSDGEVDFVQVQFKLDGRYYTYRCKDSGALNDILDGAEPTELASALSDCTNPGAALGGMYCDWDNGGTTTVSERPAVFGVMKKAGPGLIAWLDYVPGVLYSLTASDDVTQDILTEVAERCFVPFQDDVG